MKKINFILCLVALFTVFQLSTAIAQSDDEIKAAEKFAKKRAKEMVSEGWQVQPGPSLFEMLKKVYLMEIEKVDLGDGEMNRYLKANGSTVATALAVGQRQAITNAKEEIVLAIKTDISGYVKTIMSNAQVGVSSAVSQNTMVSEFSNTSSGQLTNTQTVLNCYREKNNSIEVSVVVFYDAAKAARDAIVAKLNDLIKDNPAVVEDIKKIKDIPIPAKEKK